MACAPFASYFFLPAAAGLGPCSRRPANQQTRDHPASCLRRALVRGLSHEERARLLPRWSWPSVGERGPRPRDAERRRDDAPDLARDRRERRGRATALQDELPVRVVVVASAYSGDATRSLDVTRPRMSPRGSESGQVVGEAGAGGVGVAARAPIRAFFSPRTRSMATSSPSSRVRPSETPAAQGDLLAAKQCHRPGPLYRDQLVRVLEDGARCMRAVMMSSVSR